MNKGRRLSSLPYEERARRLSDDPQSPNRSLDILPTMNSFEVGPLRRGSAQSPWSSYGREPEQEGFGKRLQIRRNRLSINAEDFKEVTGMSAPYDPFAQRSQTQVLEERPRGAGRPKNKQQKTRFSPLTADTRQGRGRRTESQFLRLGSNSPTFSSNNSFRDASFRDPMSESMDDALASSSGTYSRDLPQRRTVDTGSYAGLSAALGSPLRGNELSSFNGPGWESPLPKGRSSRALLSPKSMRPMRRMETAPQPLAPAELEYLEKYA